MRPRIRRHTVVRIATTAGLACMVALAWSVTAAQAVPSGGIDTSWGTSGTATIALSTSADTARYVAALSDGSAVALARTPVAGVPSTAIMKLTSAGVLDTTFGTAGVQTLSAGVGLDTEPAGVAVRSDGKIVVAAWVNSDKTWVVARYLSTGVLDTTFGTSGIFSFPVVAAGVTTADGMALQSDGKILVSGSAVNPAGLTAYDMTVARVLENGSGLDTSFDTDGVAFVDHAGADDAHAIAVQANGAIVVVGGCSDGGGLSTCVGRLTSAGGPDPDFNGGSVYLHGWSRLATSDDALEAVDIQGDGMIVAVGYEDQSLAGDGSDRDVLITRLTTAGLLDATFNVGEGGTVTSVGTAPDIAFGVDVGADGKIVVGGVSYDAAGTQGRAVALRYTSAGVLDPTFGTAGTALVNVNGSTVSNNSHYGMAVAADGRIYLTGDSMTPGNEDAVVVRLLGRVADLSVTTTASVASLRVGDTVRYTMAIANAGPDGAYGVRLGVGLGHGSYVAATTTQGTCTAASMVACTIGTIASGSSVTVVIDVKALSAGSLVNIATVTESGSYDTSATNNTATSTLTVSRQILKIALVGTTASGAPRKCGASLKRVCAVLRAGKVYLRATLTPIPTAKAARKVTVQVWRRKPKRNRWIRVRTVSVYVPRASGVAVITVPGRRLGRGTFRARASVPTTVNTRTASSGYFYFVIV